MTLLISILSNPFFDGRDESGVSGGGARDRSAAAAARARAPTRTNTCRFQTARIKKGCSLDMFKKYVKQNELPCLHTESR